MSFGCCAIAWSTLLSSSKREVALNPWYSQALRPAPRDKTGNLPPATSYKVVPYLFLSRRTSSLETVRYSRFSSYIISDCSNL